MVSNTEVEKRAAPEIVVGCSKGKAAFWFSDNGFIVEDLGPMGSLGRISTLYLVVMYIWDHQLCSDW